MAVGAATAAGTTHAVENATVTPQPAENALRVSGVIGPAFEPDVRRALRRHPRLRHLIVESPGGLRAQALRVGQLVNRRGMTVRVEGRCASACALLWATAASRELTAGSRIGLHRSSLDGGLPIPDAMREQLMRYNDRETDEVLRKAGFPLHVVEAGAGTPPTAMAWFTADELAGVRFALFEPASTSRPEPRRMTADMREASAAITPASQTSATDREGR